MPILLKLTGSFSNTASAAKLPQHGGRRLAINACQTPGRVRQALTNRSVHALFRPIFLSALEGPETLAAVSVHARI
ncbi:hypothetical protein CO662_10525 [Rhizobium anhuiense]|uniref:Uncharacterized protein n=1 Tax=Rhizobium anhuiense TaxID=1184720 RepID=A0A432NPY9_9HYPH|nr:hypothetical protein [Rhizobium anhuiense]PDS36282.1 hypothetical protein CO665_20550 [Rhizobium anhuiense]PDS44466.1 hypothetical protein CO668_13105 [Rhizobium anhuiense]PDS52064.1 hypothetical protein CO662_10525 [Rhizobium anhuiense]PDS57820.1 hypothetical protein CO663_17255 [Rhizobium anhuiense]